MLFQDALTAFFMQHGTSCAALLAGAAPIMALFLENVNHVADVCSYFQIFVEQNTDFPWITAFPKEFSCSVENHFIDCLTDLSH